jgi:predicted esterase
MATQLSFAHRFVPRTRPSRMALLLLHGTGGNEHDLLSLGGQLAPGAPLLSPRGQVLEQGAPRFFRRLAEGVFDLADLERRTGELAAFVEEARVAYGLEADELYAVGYSNGANIASSLMLRRPGLLRGAVLFRAMVPFEPAEPPALTGTSILISEGRRDPIVPSRQAERLEQIFRAAGADVTVQWQAAGHELTIADVRAATEWLEKQGSGATG